MYHQVHNSKFHFLPTQRIYVLCVDLRTNSHYTSRQFFRTLLKLRAILMVLAFLTPNVITKLPSPTKGMENGLNPQTEFVIKTHCTGCYLSYAASHHAQFSAQYHNQKTTPFNTSCSFHTRQLVSNGKTAAAVSQYVCTPFPTAPLFHLGNILMEPFAMLIGEGSHVFREKNSKWECNK